MAEFVVSPLLSVLSEKLAAAVVVILGDLTATPSVVHTLFRKLNISQHNRELLKRELVKLHALVLRLKPLIVESEKRLEVNKEVDKDLVKFKQVKDAALEVDDILDQLFLFSSSSNSMVHKVSNSFSLLKIPTFSRILHRIKHVTKMFDEMIDHRVWNMEFPNQLLNMELLETTSLLFESHFHGREGDKMKIVDMLISPSEEEENLSFISIVGMGGIGKTTLAKLVYNDEWVVRLFDKRVWIHVGQIFDEAKITQKIIQSVKGECSSERMSLLTVELLEVLGGGRFLIVLDDLWNEYGERWDPLKDLLQRSSCYGCKILVTTRSVEVAMIINRSSMYHLGFLSDEYCRALILDTARLYEREPGETPDLLRIANVWAKKCKGLPLAAKVVGSKLGYTDPVRALASLGERISSIHEYEMVLNSLKLSYDYLPSHLKQCFAYCSIFPKGCTIKKEKLIQLWMAEGFIQSSQQRITLEEIGNDYFMKLLWVSFFQAAKQDDCDHIIEFTMHEFVHDLAQFVATIGSSILEAGEVEKTSRNVRYLSLVCGPTLTKIPKSLFSENLRTLLIFSSSLKYLKRIPSDTFSSFRCLRVLDLSRTGICKLPASVCLLTQLRYLELSHTSIEKLPKSFSKLMNLETLKLSECYRLSELPKDLETMVNLRHLDVSQCCSLSHLPSGLGKLTCLQRLSTFIVGMDKQYSLRELRWLNLGGKLEITNLKHVTNFLDADEANLMEKLNLQSLGLSWGHEYKEDLERSEGYVLERLQPHSNVRELSITGCKTVYFPEWIGNLLNLVKISIINFRHCNYLPSLGQLPHLKYLYIKGMDAIECIDYAFYGDGSLKGFPSLEEIEIYNMPKLEEWLSLPESSDAFSQLNKLIVEGCPYLTRLPFFPVLSYLTLWGSNESLLSSVCDQPSLSSLVINDFQDLLDLPDEIGNSNSLKKITVYNCNNLISVIENGNVQWLTSLEQLSILYCKDLIYLSMEPRHLVSLQRLDIIQCPQLAYLPELIELTSLQALTIDGCPRLASFPDGMHRMVSLQELRIKRCPNLNYLPVGFERITSLLYLEIGGCNILESRLQMDGEDWHKIAHIPTISIVKM